MSAITLYDAYDNIVTNLTQWDANYLLKTVWEYENAPYVQFTTRSGKHNYTMPSSLETVGNKKIASFYVPNIILQQTETVVLFLGFTQDIYEEVSNPTADDFESYYIYDGSNYVQATGSFDDSETYYILKTEIDTIFRIVLPIRKREKPNVAAIDMSNNMINTGEYNSSEIVNFNSGIYKLLKYISFRNQNSTISYSVIGMIEVINEGSAATPNNVFYVYNLGLKFSGLSRAGVGIKYTNCSPIYESLGGDE